MQNKIAHHKHKKSLIKFAFLITFLFTVCFCCDLKRPFDFPLDHGPHFNSTYEWWYFTGETLTMEGKTLGYEFVIFKHLIFCINEFFCVGHLAVSNSETSEHFFAKVATPPYFSDLEKSKTDIKINNFSYTFSEYGGFTIKAKAGNLSVDLSLTPTMDVLPHGQDGIIVMGDGIDSYYYSFTNLLTVGNISINGFDHSISSGRTWMDHQWGSYTSLALSWDWFSLRFDDGSALMFIQHRNIFNNVVGSDWTYRSSTGSVKHGKVFSVQATRTYKDENGNCTYPIDWVVEVSDIDAKFLVKPLFDEQCLYDFIIHYWEGLCSVEGSISGERVTGSAYVELTGPISITHFVVFFLRYAREPMQILLRLIISQLLKLL